MLNSILIVEPYFRGVDTWLVFIRFGLVDNKSPDGCQGFLFLIVLSAGISLT